MKKLLISLATLMIILAFSINSFAITGKYFDLPVLDDFDEEAVILNENEQYVRAKKSEPYCLECTYAVRVDEYEGIYLTADDLFDKAKLEKELDDEREFSSQFEDGSFSVAFNSISKYTYVEISSIYDYMADSGYKEYKTIARIPTEFYYVTVEVASTISQEDCEKVFDEIMKTIDIKEFDDGLVSNVPVDKTVEPDKNATQSETGGAEEPERVTKSFSVTIKGLPLVVVAVVVALLVNERKKRNKTTEDKSLDN